MPFLLYRKQTQNFPPIQRCAAGGEIGPPGPGDVRHGMASALPPSGGGDAVPTAGAKGDVGHLRFPMSPLDTPLTFHWPLSEAFAAKRGLRGLGSVRRAGFGTLLCPEFTLRDLPRMIVRGQTVQGVRTIAAKSSASIKRVLLEHQTPLWAPRF